MVVPVAYAAMWLVIDPVTVTPDAGLEAALTPALDQLRSVRRVTTPLSLAALGWAVLVWRAGLQHRRNLDGTAATLIAVSVGLLIAVGTVGQGTRHDPAWLSRSRGVTTLDPDWVRLRGNERRER